MLKRSEIHIRDPFILPNSQRGIYYMYGTNGGHAMLFYRFDGTRMISLHAPNASSVDKVGQERALFLEY